MGSETGSSENDFYKFDYVLNQFSVKNDLQVNNKSIDRVQNDDVTLELKSNWSLKIENNSNNFANFTNNFQDIQSQNSQASSTTGGGKTTSSTQNSSKIGIKSQNNHNYNFVRSINEKVPFSAHQNLPYFCTVFGDQVKIYSTAVAASFPKNNNNNDQEKQNDEEKFLEKSTYVRENRQNDQKDSDSDVSDIDSISGRTTKININQVDESPRTSRPKNKGFRTKEYHPRDPESNQQNTQNLKGDKNHSDKNFNLQNNNNGTNRSRTRSSNSKNGEPTLISQINVANLTAATDLRGVNLSSASSRINYSRISSRASQQNVHHARNDSNSSLIEQQQNLRPEPIAMRPVIVWHPLKPMLAYSHAGLDYVYVCQF